MSAVCVRDGRDEMSDSSRVTELDLVVGSMITVRPEEDREAYDEERETIADVQDLSLIHISEPTRLLSISYAVFCLKKKKQKKNKQKHIFFSRNKKRYY